MSTSTPTANIPSTSISPPLSDVSRLAPVVAHLSTNIFALTRDKINTLVDLRYTTWSAMTNRMKLSILDLELKHKCYSMGVCIRLKHWFFYYKTDLPTQNEVLSLDSTNYNDDMMELQHHYYMTRNTRRPPIQTPKPTDVTHHPHRLINPNIPHNSNVTLSPPLPPNNITTPSHSNSPKFCTATPTIAPSSPPPSNTPPIIHTTFNPSDTPSSDNSSAANAFDHGFVEGYDAACDNFNSLPPSDHDDAATNHDDAATDHDDATTKYDAHVHEDVNHNDDFNGLTYNYDDNADTCYDDECAYDAYSYDDGGYDDIDPEPPPW